MHLAVSMTRSPTRYGPTHGQRSRRALPGLLIAALIFSFGGCSSSVSDESTSAATPTSWVPSKPLTAPSMSPAEMMEARAANLKKSAELAGLRSPKVPDLVRWTTLEEQIPLLVKCVNDKGFDAKVKDGSGIESTVEPAQQSAYDLALWQCEAMYSVDARLYNFPGAALEMDYWWDYWNEFEMACLAAHGHPAERELPSREVFANDAWFFEQAYPKLSDEAEMTALKKACPPTPPTSLLLGQGWTTGS